MVFYVCVCLWKYDFSLRSFDFVWFCFFFFGWGSWFFFNIFTGFYSLHCSTGIGNWDDIDVWGASFIQLDCLLRFFYWIFVFVVFQRYLTLTQFINFSISLLLRSTKSLWNIWGIIHFVNRVPHTYDCMRSYALFTIQFSLYLSLVHSLSVNIHKSPQKLFVVVCLVVTRGIVYYFHSVVCRLWLSGCVDV